MQRKEDDFDFVIFKSKNTLDIDGLYINTMPSISVPAKRVTAYKISGRSGDLRAVETSDDEEEVFDSIIKDVGFSYKGKETDMIKRLFRGTSELILSNQPDRFFKASVDNLIPFELLMQNVHNFTVSFSCFPYAYLLSGEKNLVFNPTTTTWETIIMNNYENSLPLLTIFGKGNIGVKINGVETDFLNVDGHIVCDSELKQTYKDKTNQGLNMVGRFPLLVNGENVIEFTGNIKQVKIKPRWRTL